MPYSLMHWYERPFEILEKRKKVMYKLKFLESLKIIHLVVHVSKLEPFQIDADHSSRVGLSREPILVMDKPKCEVEEVLDHHFIRHG